MNIPLSLLIYFALFLIGNSKLEEGAYDLIINAEDTEDNIVGMKSTFVLETNCSNPEVIFDSSDIEKQIFETKLLLKDKNAKYKIKCKLWKPEEQNLLILCDLQEEIKDFSEEEIYLEEHVINYKEKKIKIFTLSNLYYLEKKSYNIPLLYSNNQTIDLSDGKNEYELKFKVGSYYESNVFLNMEVDKNPIYIDVDNCKVENGEMTCKIKRETVENKFYFIEDELIHILSVFNIGSEYCLRKHKFANYVIIKFNKIEREIIKVGITKALTKATGLRSFFAYETDVKNISSMITGYGYFKFVDIDNDESDTASCLFKKNDDDKPLLLLCRWVYLYEDHNMSLSESDNESDETDMSIKYIFRIKPIKNKEIIRFSGESFFIAGKYPSILDYTHNDEQTFFLYVRCYYYPVATKELTLGLDLPALNCSNSRIGFNCIVPKSYFKGKKSGYYNIYYINYLGEKVMFYEADPFQVILSDNHSNYSKKNDLSYISLIFFFILALI